MRLFLHSVQWITCACACSSHNNILWCLSNGCFSSYSFCGSYVGHRTVFRIADHSPEVEFRCSSRNSAQPFQASYSSYNISQRKHCRARTWLTGLFSEGNDWSQVFHCNSVWMSVNGFVFFNGCNVRNWAVVFFVRSTLHYHFRSI